MAEIQEKNIRVPRKAVAALLRNLAWFGGGSAVILGIISGLLADHYQKYKFWYTLWIFLMSACAELVAASLIYLIGERTYIKTFKNAERESEDEEIFKKIH